VQDMTPLLIALLVFGTVFFLLLGLAAGSRGSSLARERLEGFKRGGQPADVPEETSGFRQRVLMAILGGLANGLGNLLPRSLIDGVRKSLLTAGEPMTLTGFLITVVLSFAASIVLAGLVLVVSGGELSTMMIGLMGIIPVVGFVLPFWMLKSRARARQAAIIKSLPDAFDLITTCVEAGLGLDAALSRVAEKIEGPFADELSRALREVSLGKTRRESLKELGDRTAVPDLVQFTNAVIQAEAMGSSIGAVLRVQSDQLRVRRRQRAEEAAYKAPVKMLFPLVLFIFPTLFIVILGPAAITIMQDFPAR
jgi:tight adherence protein C